MKKLLLMATLIMASLTRCDQLLDAIHQHKLQEVTLLLQQKKYEATNYSQYITAAREVVDRCQNDLKAKEIDSETVGKMVACIYVAASIYPLYSLFKIQAQHDICNIPSDALLWPLVQLFGGLALGSFIGTMVMILPFIPLCCAYGDAVEVEKLLLGHQFE